MDPTEPTSCARLRYERRDPRAGLFITSDDAALKTDTEQALGLNSGDLPELREQAWKAFCKLQHEHAPAKYGHDARRAYLATWLQRSAQHPEMLGVVEAKLR